MSYTSVRTGKRSAVSSPGMRRSCGSPGPGSWSSTAQSTVDRNTPSSCGEAKNNSRRYDCVDSWTSQRRMVVENAHSSSPGSHEVPQLAEDLNLAPVLTFWNDVQPDEAKAPARDSLGWNDRVRTRRGAPFLHRVCDGVVDLPVPARGRARPRVPSIGTRRRAAGRRRTCSHDGHGAPGSPPQQQRTSCVDSWTSQSADGWSGETHIHLAREAMRFHMLAEDLNLAPVLERRTAGRSKGAGARLTGEGGTGPCIPFDSIRAGTARTGRNRGSVLQSPFSHSLRQKHGCRPAPGQGAGRVGGDRKALRLGRPSLAGDRSGGLDPVRAQSLFVVDEGRFRFLPGIELGATPGFPSVSWALRPWPLDTGSLLPGVELRLSNSHY